jgi:hypothetical protein
LLICAAFFFCCVLVSSREESTIYPRNQFTGNVDYRYFMPLYYIPVLH